MLSLDSVLCPKFHDFHNFVENQSLASNHGQQRDQVYSIVHLFLWGQVVEKMGKDCINVNPYEAVVELLFCTHCHNNQ